MRAVYEYAEPVKEKGFVFMDTPGFDPVGATGQVAGGSNVMCFTTGRGSAFGCKPAPSIKLATNTDMYRRMTEDMDINCGDVLDGTSIETKGQEIFEKGLAGRLGHAHQIRRSRLWRSRIRAMANRRGDVGARARNRLDVTYTDALVSQRETGKISCVHLPCYDRLPPDACRRQRPIHVLVHRSKPVGARASIGGPYRERKNGDLLRPSPPTIWRALSWAYS